MLESKGKISLRQAFFLFILITFSPAIRLTPAFALDKAKQVAWLTPLPALIPCIIMIFVLNRVFKVYKDKSLMDAVYDIMGRWIGKVMVCIYFLWNVWLTAIYLRYDVERLVSSTYPNVDPNLFAIVTIAMVAYILPKGITVIGRMSEILLPVTILTFVFLCLFLFPEVRIDSVIPVSTKDVMPIVHGSFVTTAIGSYMLTIFFMGEFINDKEKLFKSGIWYSIVYILLSIVLVFVTVGTLTSSVSKRLPIAFLVAVKQISILDTVEKIESLIVGTWIYADFILLSVFSFVTLNMLKSLFNLRETKHLLNIFLVLIFFLSVGMAKNRFELSEFSDNFLVYINSVFAIGFPVILFVVGKIRKKI